MPLPKREATPTLFDLWISSNQELEDARPRSRQLRALTISIVITLLMMVVEFVGGYWTGSLLLISDAVHMLSHALSLGISLAAIMIARTGEDDRLTFGFYRVEILAALINGITLAGFSAWIGYEAITRVMNPTDVQGLELTLIAILGLVVNLTTAFILARAGLEDLNTKSAFKHMLADTFSSVVTVIGGILIIYGGWMVIDPILSMVVALIILKWAWGLSKDAVFILLERKPEHLNLEEIENEVLKEFPEVKHIHDLHVWEITSQFVCMTAHVVIEDMKISETMVLKKRIKESLKERFEIGHIVLQFEC